MDKVHPEGRGLQVAMRSAMRDAETKPEELSYLAAHGLSGVEEDKAESTAVRRVFGEVAKRLPVSAAKSMMGYPGAASGILDMVCALAAMRGGFIPPTINYQQADPACDLAIVANEARPARVDRVLVEAFGLGGQAAAVVVKRMD
jgi:3-oxoacyl-(acyl-carrier-protein) synthase